MSLHFLTIDTDTFAQKCGWILQISSRISKVKMEPVNQIRWSAICDNQTKWESRRESWDNRIQANSESRMIQLRYLRLSKQHGTQNLSLVSSSRQANCSFYFTFTKLQNSASTYGQDWDRESQFLPLDILYCLGNTLAVGLWHLQLCQIAL